MIAAADYRSEVAIMVVETLVVAAYLAIELMTLHRRDYIDFETGPAAVRTIVWNFEWEQAVIGSEAFPDLDTKFEAAVVYFAEVARVDHSLTHPLSITIIQLCIDVISYYNMCLR